MDATKSLRANVICMPLQKTPKPTSPRVLFCSIACLPDERHITGSSTSTAVMDTDRVCAVYLDVHLVVEVDGDDVSSRRGTEPPAEGYRAERVVAGPYDEGVGNMQ